MKRVFKLPRDNCYYLNKLKEKSQITKTCWLWEGARVKAGYGRISYQGKYIGTHQLSMLLCNRYKAGKVVDHICKVKNCWNPAHLRMVTTTENTARFSDSPSAKNYRKEVCIRGHKFSYETKNSRGNKIRVCRECGKLRKKVSKS